MNILFTASNIQEWLEAPIDAFTLVRNGARLPLRGQLASLTPIPASTGNPGIDLAIDWNRINNFFGKGGGITNAQPKKVGLMPIESTLRPSPAAPKPVSATRYAASDALRDWTQLGSYDLGDHRQFELSAGSTRYHDGDGRAISSPFAAFIVYKMLDELYNQVRGYAGNGMTGDWPSAGRPAWPDERARQLMWIGLDTLAARSANGATPQATEIAELARKLRDQDFHYGIDPESMWIEAASAARIASESAAVYNRYAAEYGDRFMFNAFTQAVNTGTKRLAEGLASEF